MLCGLEQEEQIKILLGQSVGVQDEVNELA